MAEGKATIVEGYELPSKGLIYEKRFNPHVELRGMTVREEMKRLSPTTTEFKKMCNLIESCIVSEKFPIGVYDMCIGDYEYLLHKLRVMSHGPTYKMNLVCPNCGKVVEEAINLDSLKTKDFDPEEFSSLLRFHLDSSDKEVTIKFQTPRILDEISTKVSEMKKHNAESDVDYELLSTLEFAIDTVDGVKLSYADKITFINNLPVRDMNKILARLQLVNKKVGLETDSIPVTCSCGYEILTFFRYQSEFFRPAVE